jgi:subtilisin family serine protease
MFLHNTFKNCLILLGLACCTTTFAAEKSTYIITFEDDAFLRYEGGIAGFSATNPQANGQRKPNFKTPAAQAYLQYLDDQQNAQLDVIKSALGRDLSYLLQYNVVTNGAAIELYPEEVNVIRQLPGITNIEKNVYYELDTDAGPAFIGAETIWNGSNTPHSNELKGEGIVIAVLDTGINSDHPSFSDVSEDGYDFAAANPLGAGNFLGDCAPPNPTITCNNKLIGAWDFTNDGANGAPEDSNGHGSHTAATAAGNYMSAPPGGFIDTGSGSVLDAPSVSGVAPHAHIIAYDVCVSSCASAAIIGAINQSVLDGADVLSFSISGGTSPWVDNDRTFLDALDAGIVISTSAGNTRAQTPDPVAAVNHLAPWVLSVANSTHNRANSNNVDITGPGTVPASLMDMYGLLGVADNFSGDLAADIIYAGDVDPGNFEGCAAWTGTPFTGSVALISRGSCSFADKINFAQTAGAAGVIIFNNQGPVPIVMGGIETTAIPAVMVGLTDGQNMVSFIQNAVTTATVSILGTPTYRLIDVVGDVLSSGSLRGPNLSFDVTKPDINGPGTNIFAAYADNLGAHPQMTFLSGTSMSAPHVAGAAALVIQANPTWTPSEVKSAMMMTSKYANNKKDNGIDAADADDVGSGTIDLTAAARAGLVMDETFANYLAADPNSGGDPRTLNLPSMRNSTCVPNCQWTRTLRTTQHIGTTWDISTDTDGSFTLQVSPTSVTFESNDVIFHDVFEDAIVTVPRSVDEVTITVTASGVPDVNDGMAFGEVIFSEQSGAAPDARLTVTVNQDNPPF